MNTLQRGVVGGAEFAAASTGARHASPRLFEVVWRRRWTILITMLGFLVAGVVHLAVATKMYVSTAQLVVEQNGPKVWSGERGGSPESETYLQTQVEAVRAAPVLSRALEAVDYRAMRTFAGVTGDPVQWLRGSGALKVEVLRKSDVLAVSLESPDPREAAALANQIVDAYVAKLSAQEGAVGQRMLDALTKEREGLHRQREALERAMLKSKLESGVFSFREEREKGNSVLDRTQSLASALALAEVATVDLRAQQKAVRSALADPATLSAYVQGIQSDKGKDSGDGEYDQLRRELVQALVAIARSEPLMGTGHPRRQALESMASSLRTRIAEKERAIAAAELVRISALLAAAEEKEAKIRGTWGAQEERARGLARTAAEYAQLEADAARVEKQCESLEQRIAEVTVDNMRAGVLNVRVLEPARPADRPARPRKLIVLLAASLAGCVLGIGAAMLREWTDRSLRNPDDVSAVLETRLLTTVPRLNARLSPVARGQLAYLDPRSPGAEAYRVLRTALQVGLTTEARTILVASPTAGDGRSTTASNLAITLAQAGYRTLLIDCDLRSPVQHMIFDVHGTAGLSGVLVGDGKLGAAIRPTMQPGLYLLPCGPVPPNPSELLAGKRFAKLMESLIAAFDRVVIDSSPLAAVTDADILAAAADATVLVCRMNRSSRTLAALVLDGLARVGATVVGAVANDAPLSGRFLGHSSRGVWEYATSAKRIEAAVSANGRSGEPGGDRNGNGAGPRNGKFRLDLQTTTNVDVAVKPAGVGGAPAVPPSAAVDVASAGRGVEPPSGGGS